ncbi:MAG: isopropylmalate isomerase [Pseudomonadota bacterium]
MTDDTPPEDTPPENTGKKSNARNAAIGAAATIGSAAIAAALLYVGKRAKKKPEDSAIGSDQAKTPPSGEPPETD